MICTDYQSKNSDLFTRWKAKHSQKYGQTGFISDGIVNPKKWFSQDNSEERILFILKEAYDKEGNVSDWNEVKWLNQEKCTENCTKNIKCTDCTITGSTFNFIASVVYGLTENPSNIYDSWLGLKNGSTSDFKNVRNELLKKIAIVNIKKSNGNSQSKDDDIYYYAADDKELIIEQIKLINPTLIICGGTYKYLRCIFTDLPRLDDLSNGFCMYDSIKIIAAAHPNSHNNGEEKYNSILSNYNKL